MKKTKHHKEVINLRGADLRRLISELAKNKNKTISLDKSSINKICENTSTQNAEESYHANDWLEEPPARKLLLY